MDGEVKGGPCCAVVNSCTFRHLSPSGMARLIFGCRMLPMESWTMGDTDVLRIRREPMFRDLVDKRTRFAWALSAAMLVIYFGFILVIAFAPKLLGTPIGGGVMTV